MRRPLLALASSLAFVFAPSPARATGMQGHIYMAHCGAEFSDDARVKKLLAEQRMRLTSGAMFPDSGYTAPDHDQGEIAHWEGYIEGYLKTMRERHGTATLDEAPGDVAFIFGAAAHGITDSTFDTLFFPRSEQVDKQPDIDTAMDILLSGQLKRSISPTLDFDADTLSSVYNNEVKHPVTPDAITEAMKTARSGVGAAMLLGKSPGFYEENYPWAARSMLDPRVPGGYTFGGRVVAGYYREILRRLSGDTSADGALIGVYPSADYPMATLRHDRPESRVLFFFGIGLDRGSLADVAQLTGPDGATMAAKVDVFRGDTWANALTLEIDGDWAPATTYHVVLRNTFRTLEGTSPAKDFEFSFTTCTPDPATGDCPDITGPRPASPCPVADQIFVKPEDLPGGGAGAAGSAGAGGDGQGGGAAGGAGSGAPAAEAASSDPDSGCSAATGGASGRGAAAALLLVGAALGARARRRGGARR